MDGHIFFKIPAQINNLFPEDDFIPVAVLFFLALYLYLFTCHQCYVVEIVKTTKLTTKSKYLQARHKVMLWKTVLLALTTKNVIATQNCLFVIGDWVSVLYTVWFYTCGL